MSPQEIILTLTREDLLVTRSRVRVAAWAATTILVAVAGLQFYAVFHAASGVDPPPAKALVFAVFVGVLAFVAGVVLLIRVGYLREWAPYEVGRTGAWAGLGGAVLGFAGQTDTEWYVAGPINLVISLLAFTVAYSELPESSHDSLKR